MRDGFEERDGGDDLSVALGEPGIGASCTLITFCRFALFVYLEWTGYSPPVTFLTAVFEPSTFGLWLDCDGYKCLLSCAESNRSGK